MGQNYLMSENYQLSNDHPTMMAWWISFYPDGSAGIWMGMPSGEPSSWGGLRAKLEDDALRRLAQVLAERYPLEVLSALNNQESISSDPVDAVGETEGGPDY